MKKNVILKKIEKISSKIEKNRIFKKDSSYFKVEDNVFDIPTLKSLSTFVNRKIISSIGGSISTGKEANIFHAMCFDKELAIKIYRITSSTFKTMNPYILKDFRFENIKHRKKDIIFSWAQKEYQNLMRLYNVGVSVPKPIIRDRNIVIMEFLGCDGIAYPQLKKLDLDSENADNIYCSIIEDMKKMYLKASLVHSDLSEYNILISPETMNSVIIDVGQSVVCSHPQAQFFLKRDISNITRFFKKYNLYKDEKSIYNFIVQDD